MITICTVLCGSDDLLDIFLESAARKTKLISEVVVADVNEHGKNAEFTSGRLNVRRFHYCGGSHPTGMHACIERATQEYVMLSDPDVFFLLPDIDQFYLDAFHRFDLGIIGVSHYSPMSHAQGWFPTVINCLVRKCNLPDNKFLSGKIKRRETIFAEVDPCNGKKNSEDDNYGIVEDGLWLECTPIPEFRSLFPFPNVAFDVGCNLWLWALWNNLRWMSFPVGTALSQNTYTHYTASVNNFEEREDFGNLPLLIHAGNCSSVNQERLSMFQKAYERLGNG